MRIGIDMRMAGTGEGIGRYCEELVKNLADIDQGNDYFLLIDRKSAIADKLSIKNSKFNFVKVSSTYYSIAEQTYFIHELNRLNLDIMHFTSFNMPIFYTGKFIVTIHDTIHHRFPGRKKSRYLHRAAYRAVIWTAVKRAQRIIAVSNATKNEIVKTFGVTPEKVKVVYEGIGKALTAEGNEEETLKRHNITKPFLLFVGVWRQYKNLPQLALAFDILKEKYGIDCQLALAGKIDPFYPEIKQAVFGIKNHADIRVLGFVSDEILSGLYRKAKIFVLPSLVEGFGLTGPEAQALGAPVAASDIPALREVLAEGAVYFDPQSAEDMAEKIVKIWNSADLTKDLRRLGFLNAERFNWDKCSRETLNLYKKAS